MECEYCSEKAVKWVILPNKARMNVCEHHADFAKSVSDNIVLEKMK